MPVGSTSLFRTQICASGGLIRSQDRSTEAVPTPSPWWGGGRREVLGCQCLGDQCFTTKEEVRIFNVIIFILGILPYLTEFGLKLLLLFSLFAILCYGHFSHHTWPLWFYIGGVISSRKCYFVRRIADFDAKEVFW